MKLTYHNPTNEPLDINDPRVEKTLVFDDNRQVVITPKRVQPTSEQYRAAAKRLFPAPDGKEITVGTHAKVQPVFNDGAFVDITVWIDSSEAEKENSDG